MKRPKKEPTMDSDATVGFDMTVSPDEYDYLAWVAKRCGLSVEQLVRAVIALEFIRDGSVRYGGGPADDGE
jgi:hypothetical protein